RSHRADQTLVLKGLSGTEPSYVPSLRHPRNLSCSCFVPYTERLNNMGKQETIYEMETRSRGLGRGGFARLSLGARIRVQGGAPEGARPRLADGARRVAGANACSRPPRHGHIAAVDRVEPAVRLAPKGAVGAARSEGLRRRRDALAAPLPAARLRPMCHLFGLIRSVRRMTAAQAVVFSELAPERAGPAIGGPSRAVDHRPAFDRSLTSWTGVGVKSVGCGGGGGGTVHPPPRASIRPISDSSSRVCRMIARRSSSSAALCAVTTSRYDVAPSR